VAETHKADLSSMLNCALSGGWEAARDALIPAAEDADRSRGGGRDGRHGKERGHVDREEDRRKAPRFFSRRP
jgi:hypothetical protein